MVSMFSAVCADRGLPLPFIVVFSQYIIMDKFTENDNGFCTPVLYANVKNELEGKVQCL